MFVVRCFRCKEVLGGIMNPNSIPSITCMYCGHENSMMMCVDKAEYYEDSRERGVLEDQTDKDSELRKTMFEQKVLV